ncbi:MAG: SPFH domain-containing protein [Gemmiger sp.]|nr:SPFH domain-containing protein [Gemmiger sp.]
MLISSLFFALSLILILGLIAGFIVTWGYVKAPPDQAYIISGMKSEGKILIGRAGIRIPFLERLDKLYLGQMTVDIKTEQSVPTNDFINVNVDAVAKVRISPTTDGIKQAAKNFLNKHPEAITADLQDSLQGNMREIIGTLTLKDINTDRDSFSDQVMQKASRDMEKLGIEILSCNIQNVTDENGLIKDLGADNTSRIKKDAAIAKAQADRDVAIAQSEADKTANEARVRAQTEIAQRNNELAIREAELKAQSDAEKAKADAAYEIQQQAQRKTIEIAKADADIAKQEKEVIVKQREAEVQEESLNATIKKQADADLYKRKQEAEAKKFEQERSAEAEKFAAQQRAEALRIGKEQEAAGIKVVGEAEAEAIRQRGVAEAEAMEKKAEAYKKYGQAAMAEMVVKILPQIAKEVATPLEKIDKITIFGGGSDGSAGVDGLAGNVPAVMARTFQTVKEATGIDLADIVRAETYDAKVTQNLNISGLGEGASNQVAAATAARALADKAGDKPGKLK